MQNTHRILSVLLALLLVGSHMALSGHVSSHTTTDSGLCSLCVHPSGADHAIAHETTALFVSQPTPALNQRDFPACFEAVSFHDHQSRAPPRVT